MSLVAYASSDDNSESEEDVATEKKRQPVKISIPSLKEFKEEEKDETTTKKLKPKGGSGLFSILPPPKHSAISSKPGFTPYVFSKKKEIKPSQTSVIKKAPPTSNIESSVETDDSVLDTPVDSTEKVDFFSLHTDKPLDDSSHISNEKSETLSSDEVKPVNSTPSPLYQYETEELSTNISDSTVDESSSTSYQSSYPSGDIVTSNSDFVTGDLESGCSSTSDVSSPSDFLKDERFLKLMKRKQDPEDINIIDISAAEQLTGKDEWLMQSLTEEKVHRPIKRRHDFPTQQQKRKHQITYLAYQAKEREMDLKNQWALNNRTRRETQAKYGF